jgi:hypothetical protein
MKGGVNAKPAPNVKTAALAPREGGRFGPYFSDGKIYVWFKKTMILRISSAVKPMLKRLL